MKKTIIAICGTKRSGKSTVGNFISQYFIYKKRSIKFLAFGDTVKETAAAMMGFEKDFFKDDGLKDMIFTFIDGKSYTGRTILQVMGTEALRDHFNSSVWITALNNKLVNSICDINIVTDLRFRNEYDYFQSLKEWFNVIIVRVMRLSVKNDDSHRSETEFRKFIYDYTIDNNTDSLEDLKQQTFLICEKLDNI